MGVPFDEKGFEDDLQEQLKRSREAFDGKYKEALTELAGFSKQQIAAIAPGAVGLQKYDELMTVVKEASRVNMQQAQLKQQIETLGAIAVKIARKIPSLAALL